MSAQEIPNVIAVQYRILEYLRDGWVRGIDFGLDGSTFAK